MVALMSPVDPSRTQHANQAVHLSDLLTLKFARERFGTEVPRYLKVTEPDGPSTDGGRKARQAILLCPQQDDLSTNMVCGFIDVASRYAELRNYAVVKAHFERRHRRPVDITRGEYNRMLDLVRAFLDAQSYKTRVTTTRPARTSSQTTVGPTPGLPPSRNTLALALSFLLGFLFCYLLAGLGWLG